MATANDTQTISAAMEYASYGWRVVPIHPQKKHPPLKDWHKLATTDEERIVEWWQGDFAGMGVGVQFGPTSGIIDIEIDSPDAETDLIEAMGGEIPPTVTFLSGSKKLPHRIFAFHKELPRQANLPLRSLGVDADLKIGWGDSGSQSVFPPSFGKYKWLPGLSPSEIEPADLPDHFIAWIANGGALKEHGGIGKTQEQWDEIFKGANEGNRNNDLLSFAGKLAANLADINSRKEIAFFIQAVRGQNAFNRPPLSEQEVTNICKCAIQSEQRKRASAGFSDLSTPSIEGTTSENGEDQTFRLEIVESEPPLFLLYSADFWRAEESRIELTSDQLLSWNKLRCCAADQASCYLSSDRKTSHEWTRQGGICQQLMASAKFIPAPGELKRPVVVATRILELVERAPIASENDEFRRGAAKKLEDGSVVFSFNWLADELSYTSTKPTRQEINSCLNACECRRDKRVKVFGMRKQFFCLNKAGVEKLQEIAEAKQEDTNDEQE